MRLRSAAITDVGKVRPQNEDKILDEDPLFAVADGMGGHAAGEIASEIAIETLRANFPSDPTEEGLVAAFQRANAAVLDRAREDSETRGMATTLTAAAVVDQDGEQVLVIANVGDSRGYLMRDGELEQLTEDHSLVQDLVRAGRLTPEEAIDHPQRHIVTRGLGIEDRTGDGADLEVDTFTVVPFKGDRVLLASDGLSDMITDEQIASTLRRFADADDAARELIRQAKAAGGNDNISVVIVDVVDDGDKGGSASKALAGEPAPPPVDETKTSVRIAPAESPEDPDRKPKHKAPKPAKPPRQHPTVRVIGFVAAVIAVLVLAVAAITWYARGSYYVGLRGETVTIFRGRPGGFLWVEPTVEDRTNLTLDEIPPARHNQLRDGRPEPTLRAARRYIDNLRDEAATLQAATTTTVVDPSATTVTTTAP